MKKLINKVLNWFLARGVDRVLHSYFGYVIVDVTLAILKLLIIDNYINSSIAFGVLTICAFGKDIYDKRKGSGLFDIKDVLATYSGGMLKLIINLI